MLYFVRIHWFVSTLTCFWDRLCTVVLCGSNFKHKYIREGLAGRNQRHQENEVTPKTSKTLPLLLFCTKYYYFPYILLDSSIQLYSKGFIIHIPTFIISNDWGTATKKRFKAFKIQERIRSNQIYSILLIGIYSDGS